jgi:hypothetical protein
MKRVQYFYEARLIRDFENSEVTVLLLKDSLGFPAACVKI